MDDIEKFKLICSYIGYEYRGQYNKIEISLTIETSDFINKYTECLGEGIETEEELNIDYFYNKLQ